MPFAEFNAWQRYAFVKRRNKQLAAQQGKGSPLGGLEDLD